MREDRDAEARRLRPGHVEPEVLGRVGASVPTVSGPEPLIDADSGVR